VFLRNNVIPVPVRAYLAAAERITFLIKIEASPSINSCAEPPGTLTGRSDRAGPPTG
jgi:hypothetical protein